MAISAKKQKVEQWDLDKIKPYKKNAKVHTEEQIDKLASIIKEFGFTQPIVVDENGEILAGHGRRLASIKLKLKTVPVIVISDLSEQKKRAYRIADNMVARGDHNADILGQEVADLAASFDLEVLDMSLLGMDDFEIDDILANFEGDTSDLVEVENEDATSTNEQPVVESRPLPKEVEYQKAYSIIIDCTGEAEQREIYEQLTAEGRKCKIMTM